MKRLIAAFAVAAVLACAAAEKSDQSAVAGSRRASIFDHGAVQLRVRPPHEIGAGSASDALTLFVTARALAGQDKVNDAIEIYRSLTQMHPGLPEPFNNLGLLHLFQGRYENAELAFLEALRIDPRYGEAQENLGDVHARMALRAYDAAVRLEPDGRVAREKIKHLTPILRSETQPPSAGLYRTGVAPIEMSAPDRAN
jgi:colicin import membrane protein